MLFAYIKNNFVENIIVAEQDFIDEQIDSENYLLIKNEEFHYYYPKNEDGGTTYSRIEIGKYYDKEKDNFYFLEGE